MKKHICALSIASGIASLLFLPVPQKVYSDHNLFQKVIEANRNIHTIDCDISQFIFHNDTVEKFSGRYRVNNKGFFRIDYEHPSRQIVLKNEQGLSWYFPEDNLLYIIQEKTEYPVQPGIDPLKGIVNKHDPRFTMRYTGTYMYGFFTSSNHFASKDPARGLIFTIISDAENHTIFEKTISDESGKEIIREIYSNYSKNGPHFFPGRVDVLARTPRGIMRNTTFYRNVHLNREQGGNIYSLQIPHNTTKKFIDME